VLIPRGPWLALVVAALLPGRGAVEAGVRRDRLYPMSYALSAPAIAVSADGTPHMLYPAADDSLRHAWNDGDRWRDESVDETLSFCGPQSIVVDSIGRPHVAFSGAMDATLRHGVREPSGWRLTDLAPTRGQYSITLGPDGRWCPDSCGNPPERILTSGCP